MSIKDDRASLAAVAKAEPVASEAASHAAPELPMNAYYFAFGRTGVEHVDRILSAVAQAGKGYHHTEGWTEPIEDWHVFRGGSYVDWIWCAAKDAAEVQTELYEALKALVASYDGLRDLVRGPVMTTKLAAADAALQKAEGR